ncbi:MAG: asparagine synthase (glutamine-hydrolyzing) [Pyrinomonadaceae bacterium]
MCGIVAILSVDKPVKPESLERAVTKLAPRGPDEQHTWLGSNRRIGLGHARLSIIDATTGSQPIPSENGNLRIIVNGEFYDFERITRELENRGHVFRSRSDSEIALHLFEESGVECLEHLRGEFAFVIWDEENESLFAARDRFGIKPLFYARHGDAIYLASEVKALFAAGVPAAWDAESVFQNLFFSVDQDRSLFQNIRQVPPGHYLIAKRGKILVKKYWDVNYPRANERTSHILGTECIEQVRHLLDEAVSLRLRADVPVGSYLSGGVDSSSVLGLASFHSRQKPTAFTIAFDHPDFDESASARMTAEFVGAPFHPVVVKEADFAEVFVESVWKGEMIHYNAHGAARYHLSRAVQEAGFKVVLAGEGADELFAGYDFSSQALLTSGGSGGLMKWARIMLRILRPKNLSERRIAATSPWLARVSQGLAFPPHLLNYIAEKFDFLQSIISDDFVRQFRRRDPYREFFRQFDFRGTLYGREPVKQILYLWMKSLFVNYVLAAERLDMAHAVEVRLPFLDHKLFDFASSIPASFLAQNGQLKYVLREAVKPFVRDEVYRGIKQPFLAPPTMMCLGNPMYELMQDTLRSVSLESVPFFDRTSVVKFLDKLPTMEANVRSSMDPVLFMMASISVLHTHYKL